MASGRKVGPWHPVKWCPRQDLNLLTGYSRCCQLLPLVEYPCPQNSRNKLVMSMDSVHLWAALCKILCAKPVQLLAVCKLCANQNSPRHLCKVVQGFSPASVRFLCGNRRALASGLAGAGHWRLILINELFRLEAACPHQRYFEHQRQRFHLHASGGCSKAKRFVALVLTRFDGGRPL